ncbi:hypothetical protein CEXT_446951 [Caerostris extrusa]|uniref:Uncharacterized protein n=1 Tax=Caerostris extrusa TaxID=172846 RepID=A0AAV4M5M2_CAEEX|nr:hypothetical protein CEXT_446951 [Caerostris extrusa]
MRKIFLSNLEKEQQKRAKRMFRIDLVSPYVLLWTVFLARLIIPKDNKEHILEAQDEKGKERKKTGTEGGNRGEIGPIERIC